MYVLPNQSFHQITVVKQNPSLINCFVALTGASAEIKLIRLFFPPQYII